MRPRTISETSNEDKGSYGSHRNVHHGTVPPTEDQKSSASDIMATKPPAKKETKDSKENKGLFGWFSNKLSSKGPPKMKLPSDKEPTVSVLCILLISKPSIVDIGQSQKRTIDCIILVVSKSTAKYI